MAPECRGPNGLVTFNGFGGSSGGAESACQLVRNRDGAAELKKGTLAFGWPTRSSSTVRERFARPSSPLDPSDCLWVLDKSVESVLRGKRERKIAERDWRRRLSTTSTDYEGKIKVEPWTP